MSFRPAFEMEPLKLNTKFPDEPRSVLAAPRVGDGKKRGRRKGSTKVDRRAVAEFEGTIADAALRFGCSPALVSVCRAEFREPK